MSKSGNSSGIEGGNSRPLGGIAYLTLALQQRFPHRDAEIERTDNFFIHRVKDTGNHPYVIYQALPKLMRQQGLLATLQENRSLASGARDGHIHQRLEIIEAQVADEPFYIVESADGESLFDLIEKEDLDQLRGMNIIQTVLKALEPFHEKGLVYGSFDLNDIRVIRSELGDHVKLGGLYKVFKPDNPVHLGFNPEFNAPTPPEGEPHWTAQDDIYVVGMIAYRLLVGRDAYREALRTPLEASAENRLGAWETQHKSSNAFPLPRTLNPKISERFENWVVSARNTQRSVRFANAHQAVGALNDAVRRFRTDVGGGWGSPEDKIVVVHPAKGPRKRLGPLPAAFGVVMLLSAAFAGFMIWNRLPQAQVQQLRSELVEIRTSIDSYADRIGALDPAGSIGENFSKARHELGIAIEAFPPSRMSFGDFSTALEAARNSAGSAVAAYDDLANKAKSELEALNGQITSLEAIAAAGDERVAAGRSRVDAAAAAVATGPLDKAFAGLAPIASELTELVAILDAERKQASTALDALAASAGKLTGITADMFIPDSPLKGEFANTQNALNKVKELFTERKWKASEAASVEAAALAAAMVKKLDQLAADGASAVAATRAQLEALAKLLPADDGDLKTAETAFSLAKLALEDKQLESAIAQSIKLQSNIAILVAKVGKSRDEASVALSAARAQVRALEDLIAAADVASLPALAKLATAESAFGGRRYPESVQLALEASTALNKVRADWETARSQAMASQAQFMRFTTAPESKLLGSLPENNPLREKEAAALTVASAADEAMLAKQWTVAAGKYAEAGDNLEATYQEAAQLYGALKEGLLPLRSKLDEARNLTSIDDERIATIEARLTALDARILAGEIADGDTETAALDEALQSAIAAFRSAEADASTALEAFLAISENRERVLLDKLAAPHPLRLKATSVLDLARVADLALRDRRWETASKNYVAASEMLAGIYSEFSALQAATEERIATVTARLDDIDRQSVAAGPRVGDLRRQLDEVATVARSGSLDRAADGLSAIERAAEDLLADLDKQQQAVAAAFSDLEAHQAAVRILLGNLMEDGELRKQAAALDERVAELGAARQSMAPQKFVSAVQDVLAAYAPVENGFASLMRDASGEAERLDRMISEFAASMPAETTALAEARQALGEAQTFIGQGAPDRAISVAGSALASLASAADTVSDAQRRAEERMQSLFAKFAALESGGGTDLPELDELKQLMSVARTSMAEKNYEQAGEAMRRGEILVAKIEEILARPQAFDCPDTDSEQGMRMIAAGSYEVGNNSLAGRIAKDAKLIAESGESGSFVISIDEPFCIALAEVTPGEYQKFVAATGHDTKVRDELLKERGQEASEADNLDLISKGDAEDYAAWLSQQTGRNYRLPRVKQLLAASVAAAGPESGFGALSRRIGDASREWTEDDCAIEGNAVVVGTIGKPEVRVMAQCLPAASHSPLLGVRLVIVPGSGASAQRNSGGTADAVEPAKQQDEPASAGEGSSQTVDPVKAKERLQALIRKKTELESTEGVDTSQFSRLQDALSAAREAIERNDLPAALEQLDESQKLAEEIERTVKNTRIANCSEGDAKGGFVLIKAGSYHLVANSVAGRMARDARLAPDIDEANPFDLDIEEPFCIATSQVTDEDFADFVTQSKHDTKVRDAMMSGGEASPQGQDVDLVNKADAEAYADWLSKRDGRIYRLPTIKQFVATAAAAAQQEKALTDLARGVADTRREWAEGPCQQESGALVVGQIGKLENRVLAQCLPSTERSPLLGFRLITMPLKEE
ncbi:MAG: SUMF1/EgtB/PvdO family nonheme iron enzyme [Alphaproteobacteria bacterium]|nr:SUMF1/EgtB/PvdO family nonheme iron enzyme [Alphaproteobacteria bacterium]